MFISLSQIWIIAAQRLRSPRKKLRPHSRLCQQGSWCCHQVVNKFVDLNIKTFLGRYNKDGTVGPQIRSADDYPTRDEISARQKETEEALEG